MGVAVWGYRVAPYVFFRECCCSNLHRVYFKLFLLFELCGLFVVAFPAVFGVFCSLVFVLVFNFNEF